MGVAGKLKHIAAELKGHVPFTIFGALVGLAFMLVFKSVSKPYAGTLFEIFHPAHVVLSAMVTASMFGIHRKARNFLTILLIGYLGSIGVATLSDSIIPYLGEKVLGLHVPTHTEIHAGGDEHGNEDGDDHSECSAEGHSLHLGFIEDWYIITPAAILGVLIAYLLPRTKFPHAGHVLISTWASSSHILMNMHGQITAATAAGAFVVLFIAVWLPCCISDIVFPLLFVKSDLELADVCACDDHVHHSHPHLSKQSAESEGNQGQ